MPFDIAVIRLNESVDLSKPASTVLKTCSGSESILEGTAIGLGLIHRKPDLKALRLMQVRVHQRSSCSRFLAKHGIDNDGSGQLCYGSIRGDKPPTGICSGDYGGPLVYQHNIFEEPKCLIGVASFTSNTCTDPTFPSVFTNAGYFARWIQKTVRKLSRPCDRRSCAIFK